MRTKANKPIFSAWRQRLLCAVCVTLWRADERMYAVVLLCALCYSLIGSTQLFLLFNHFTKWKSLRFFSIMVMKIPHLNGIQAFYTSYALYMYAYALHFNSLTHTRTHTHTQSGIQLPFHPNYCPSPAFASHISLHHELLVPHISLCSSHVSFYCRLVRFDADVCTYCYSSHFTKLHVRFYLYIIAGHIPLHGIYLCTAQHGGIESLYLLFPVSSYSFQCSKKSIIFWFEHRLPSSVRALVQCTCCAYIDILFNIR